MKKLILLFLFSVFFSISANGQNSLWTPTTLSKNFEKEIFQRTSTPSKFKLYNLDLTAFKALVAKAPLDSSEKVSTIQVSFPDSDGNLENYIVYEAPVMEQGLSDKFPEIKSYIAKGINNPASSIRFSLTTFGLHAMLTSGNSETFYIDSHTKDLASYMVYSKKDVAKTKPFSCLVQDDVSVAAERLLESQTVFANDGFFRQYRLAMACTIEYAAFHVNAAGLNSGTINQKKAAVLSAMVVTMTRVNGIYERDLSVRMNLVANNDLVIFITSDSFDNDNASTLINQSQSVIDANIGNANYDIGHTVSTGGGGLAGLGVICSNSQKGKGITGSASPVGDTYDIDYVAHEIGHQFGANHTFNNSCDDNINFSTAVEPGSGSTIMAYAGICTPNVQLFSDAYFHTVSIAEMTNRIMATSCGTKTSNGNYAPVVNAGPDYVIPRGTPFILKGSATDANNDALTYCWEQTDIESSVQAPQQTSTSGPNFRSLSPTSSPERFMPRIEDVINNNLAPTWEVVPNVARTMNFALTVRDNRSPNGGQTNRDNTVITTASVGPFLVNSPNTAVSWVAGTNQTVTWTVAGTHANGINASFVDILLSTDGGLTYTILLASKVPNDGSEIITVPNNPGTTNRIMVRGYNHIFYDISNTNFTISAATPSFAVAFSGTAETQNISGCTINTATFTFNYTALSGFSGTTAFSASGNPDGSIVSFSPSVMNTSGTVTMTVDNLNGASGDFLILVNATSGAVTKKVPFYLSIGLGSVTPITPADNAVNQNFSLDLTWTPSPSATSYDVQVALDNTFTTLYSSGTVTTNSYRVSALSPDVTYFWRVLPKSTSCSNSVYGNTFQFTVGNFLCTTTSSTNIPVTIPETIFTPFVGTSTINISSGGTIKDINVTLDLSHAYLSDLNVKLTSPKGTTITLFDNICGGADNVMATFDDLGAALVCGTNPGISGTIKPATLLSAFNDENSTGTWTLTFTDNYDEDGGRLNNWGLNICTIDSLTYDTFEWNNFMVYPNPSRGNFTIQFDSRVKDDVNITLHDIRGRQIYNEVFKNDGLFDQELKLDSTLSGIYILTVQSSSQKRIRKIIIE
ncbi:MAG TPA: propanediol utilization protein [Flavobacterium sp.]|nr:propanediol utilization protein [Flavobacterium sp.]